MLEKIGVEDRILKDYEHLIQRELYSEIVERSSRLKGLKVAHLNATAIGGGVAELLNTVVPLMNNIGLEASWHVMPGEQEFFEVTKKMHNTLQGNPDNLTRLEKKIYVEYNKELAHQMEDMNPDIWIIHDPQPAAAINYRRDKTKNIWRCHIDTTNPNKKTWNFLKKHLKNYDAYVFSLEDFVPKELHKNVYIVPPAIDPLSSKNQMMNSEDAKRIIASAGINPNWPLITQVSRFDPWKDPKGVIDAYRIAKKEIPTLQLGLLGLITATDDPEAVRIFEDVKDYANNDSRIHLFADPQLIPTNNEQFVNAFQTHSDLIIQKSTKEGFGLVVTEALWKNKPVIGGNVGGIKLQIENGVNGYLVNNSEETAQRVTELIQNPELTKQMGEAAHQTVKEKFTTPVLLNNWLRILEETI